MAVLSKTNLALWHKELQTVYGSIQRTLDRPDLTEDERTSPTGMAMRQTRNQLLEVVSGLGVLVEMAND